MTEKIITPLISFDNYDLKEAATEISKLSKKADFSYVVTPNVDHMSRLCSDSKSNSLLAIYRQATMILCDSRILEKILRLAGKQLKAVVPGSDLTKYLFDHVLSASDKILVFGVEPEKIRLLSDCYKHLNISHVNPSMGFIDRDEEVSVLVEQVIEKEPDYIFLAVGSPRQEIFAAKLKAAGLKRGVALCIGASINFLVGVESRSPLIMQKLHLEWLYRMLQDPKRLVKRYAMNAGSLIKIYTNFKQ
jgi:exopolysaccharide biosynthesis WecB/TagA/CpsF family protein